MNPKDIQNELNSKKGEFVKHIVTETVKHTTITAEKTKNTNYAEQIVKAAQELASENTNIPDIIVKTISAAEEPQVKILYPNLMNRVFYQGAPIQMIFETKNVKTPYSCYVFANMIGTGPKRIDLFVDQNIRFYKHTIPNLLINKPNKQLPPGKYDIFVVLYDNNKGNRKQLKDSKGQPVVDNTQRIGGIEIRLPVVTGTLGPISLNPEIHITNKGDFGKTFAGADTVPLMFEVKNITKYSVSIFLQKDSSNTIELNTRTYDKPIIKLSLPIRDLIRKKVPSLNLSEYKKLVVLLRDEHGNKLSGTKLIDSVDIKINPLQLTAGGPAALATRTPSVEVNVPDDLTNDKKQRVVFTVRNIDDTSGKIDYDYEITVGDPYGGKPIMRSSGKHITITPFADPNIDLSEVKVFYTSDIGGPRPLPKRITINVIDNITKRKITTYKDVRIGEKKGTIY